jgi:hypothetical protein
VTVYTNFIFRFVIEENTKKKKKKKKPRVIHALGNIKWGFTPPQKTGAINVDQLQNKWDREHMMKQQVWSNLLEQAQNNKSLMAGKCIVWLQPITE